MSDIWELGPAVVSEKDMQFMWDHSLGPKKVFFCSQCKMVMNWDINGAGNIFLKNYESLGLNLILGPTICSLETGCCTQEAVMSLLDFELCEKFEV